MDTLKFPITFSSDTRSMVRLREGSDEYIKQLLSICLLTEPFVLPLTPDFGTADPSFSTVSPEQLMIVANKFIPEIRIEGVSSTATDDSGVTSVKFVYNR